MQTILITGGAGFIGSHLCEVLLHQGYRVAVIDNFNDYYDPAIKRGNIEEVLQNTGCADQFSLFEGDIRDGAFVKDVFLKSKPDVVVHLAACAGVRPSIEDPVLYTQVNFNGTVNILEAMRAADVKRLVFASSSSVYGNNRSVPFQENDAVDHPISPYAASKKACELICHTYHHLFEMNIACLRFFTVYGPRQRPDLAIYKFTERILRGESLPFYGDGSSKRDYTYIDDIIDGVLKTLLWTGEEGPKYDIFNLGESNTISLRRMVETIEEALGKKAELNVYPMQPGDVDITYADISKSRAVLGYAPKTAFEDGIRIFVDWYLSRSAQKDACR
ncbi:MAG: SDR family NAD(P)-dependent oxidoreductase [Clostridiales bacterium]|nr:SDR family NAD(P)-dependent oxidoreductase [Clostridiales bacterium]